WSSCRADGLNSYAPKISVSTPMERKPKCRTRISQIFEEATCRFLTRPMHAQGQNRHPRAVCDYPIKLDKRTRPDDLFGPIPDLPAVARFREHGQAVYTVSSCQKGPMLRRRTIIIIYQPPMTTNPRRIAHTARIAARRIQQQNTGGLTLELREAAYE